MKKISTLEYYFLKQNIARILDELNETPYSLYNNPQQVFLPDNMISQKTLYNILNENSNYFPSKNAISKIVCFFNANFRPGITVYDILHKLIFSEKHTRILKHINHAYEGIFWMYYLSDNYKNEIHGGVLRLSTQNNKLYAHLILGLSDDKQFDIVKNILVEGKSSAHINKQFLKYRENISGKNSEKLKHCYYCEGSAYIFPRALNIELVNPNNTDYVMYLTINIDPDTANEKYIGGLPVYLSPSCGILETRVCQMCMVRENYNSIERLFSMKDSNLKKYLYMNPTEYHRFESTIAQTKAFQRMLNTI